MSHSLPLSFYQEEATHQPFKVSLFVRLHELQAITKELAYLAMMPVPAKEKWLAENDYLLKNYLDDFTQRASFDLNMTDVDPELSRLLMEYTEYLHELMRVIDGVFPEKKVS